MWLDAEMIMLGEHTTVSQWRRKKIATLKQRVLAMCDHV
jgi:hypothetical protein